MPMRETWHISQLSAQGTMLGVEKNTSGLVGEGRAEAARDKMVVVTVQSR